jgi:ABC-type Mn2+/Zn2+ transport system permease subunit
MAEASLWSLLAIYIWPLVAECIVAFTLAMTGVHLATRDQALQTLCLAQAASLGVLIGIAVLETLKHAGNLTSDASYDFFPALIGTLIAVATSLAIERRGGRKPGELSSLFVMVFVLLTALSYWLTSVLPSLESHVTQAFFGDLVTLTNSNAVTVGIVLSGVLFLLYRNHRQFTADSFLAAAAARPAHSRVFSWAATVLLVAAVFSFGLLFTLSALFVPTVVLSFLPSGQRRHFLTSGLIAAGGTVVGLGVSLALPESPTVPTVSIAMFILSVGVTLWGRRLGGSSG